MSASLKVVSEDLKPEYTKAPAIERLSREGMMVSSSILLYRE